tara:strand:+ start:2523 stop:2753 length:231 start_codon:yes stop_codon:yes gene_type:complete
MFKKPAYIHKNQYMKTIDHAAEFEKLERLNRDMPNFEDDPLASGDGDQHGKYIKRSLAEGQLLGGVDMGRYWGNGE